MGNPQKRQKKRWYVEKCRCSKFVRKKHLSEFERILLKGYYSKKNFVVRNEIVKELRILTEGAERFYCSKDVFKMLGYKKDETVRFTKRNEKIFIFFVYPESRC